MKGNILDLVLTTSNVNHLSVQSSPDICFSDHFIIRFIPQCGVSSLKKSKFIQSYVFDYSKTDFNGVCSYLMDIDFGFYLQCDDIEFIWFVIKSLIFEDMYLFIPKISLKHNHGPKWFDSSIRHHLKCLRTL